MATTIKCTQCNHEIEITEAIRKELEDKILKETQAKHDSELAKLKESQEELIKQKEKELEEAQKEIEAKARKKAVEKVRKEYDAQIESTKEESRETEKQNQEFQEQIKDLLKSLREEKGAKKKIEIEYEKKLLAEQDKIKAEAKKEVEEEVELKIAEKDKKLSDAEKQIKILQRKIQQGSQQLQGEVHELKLEDLLKQEFAYDEIKEVPKGIKGADVIQVVKTRTGMRCGTIVWESKNTKNWTQSWVQKLVEDQRALKAEIAVLISRALPEGVKTFGQVDKIWVAEMGSAVSLAHALRQQLIGIQGIQQANKGKATKAEVVYNYLISNDFKQRIEVWVEYFKERQEEITKERMYYTKKWEKEERNILKVFENTAGIYGDLQGLIGNALPRVKYLELLDGKEENLK